MSNPIIVYHIYSQFNPVNIWWCVTFKGKIRTQYHFSQTKAWIIRVSPAVIELQNSLQNVLIAIWNYEFCVCQGTCGHTAEI